MFEPTLLCRAWGRGARAVGVPPRLVMCACALAAVLAGGAARGAILVDRIFTRSIKLSPDGSRVVYTIHGLDGMDEFTLFSKPLEVGGPAVELGVISQVPRRGESFGPAQFLVSPDGQRIVYTRPIPQTNQRELVVQPIDGSGDPIVLSDGLPGNPSLGSFHITPDGESVVFGQERLDGTTNMHGLFLTPLEGGVPRRLDTGDYFAFTTRPRFWITPDASSVVYFGRAATDNTDRLTARPLDPDGEPVVLSLLPDMRPLVSGIIDVTADSERVVFVGHPNDNRQAVYSRTLDGAGPLLQLSDEPAFEGAARIFRRELSPTGDRIGFSVIEEATDHTALFIAPVDEALKSQRVLPPIGQIVPNSVLYFTPDGTRVAFTAEEASDEISRTRYLFSISSDGASSLTPLFQDVLSSSIGDLLFSPDSRQLVFITRVQGGRRVNLYTVPVAGGPHLSLTDPLGTDNEIHDYRVTPDNRYIIFAASVHDPGGASVALPGETPFAGVFAAALEGGEPVLLSDTFPLGSISLIDVTPDSRTLLFTTFTPEFGARVLHAIPIPQPATLTLGAFALMMALPRRRRS